MFRWLLRLSFLVVLLAGVYYGSDQFGRRSETQRECNADGSVFCEGPVDGDGRYHGELRFYHPDGRVKTVYRMYHGAMDGVIFHDDSDSE